MDTIPLTVDESLLEEVKKPLAEELSDWIASLQESGRKQEGLESHTW